MNFPTLREIHDNWHLVFDREIPRLREGSQVRILWASGYYDGPATGVCEYAGRYYWFDRLPDGGLEYRGLEIANSLYAMVELTDAEYGLEKTINGLFCKHVGDYTNYTYKIKTYEGDDEPIYYRVRGETRVEDTQAGYKEFTRLKEERAPGREFDRYRDRPVAGWWASER